jgi:hypothetical protein
MRYRIALIVASLLTALAVPLRNADFVLRDTCEWTSVGSGYKWC